MSSRLNSLTAAFTILLLSFSTTTVLAQNPTFEGGPCYVIADTGDILGEVNSDGSVSWINSLPSGYTNGENLAIDPENGDIYNVAGEASITPLIIIDPTDASILEIKADIGLYDVDALTFNPNDGLLYAVNKFAKFDLKPGFLHRIDKTTGDSTFLVELTFTGPAPPTGIDPHIDGISFDPLSGVLYGIYSGYGGASYLVTIDMSSGVITVMGDTGAEDIEDISFRWDGVLIGALGSQGFVDGSDFEGLVVIDRTTFLASKLGVPYDSAQTNWDVEAFACSILKTDGSDKSVKVGGSLLPIDSFILTTGEIFFYFTVMFMLLSVYYIKIKYY